MIHTKIKHVREIILPITIVVRIDLRFPKWTIQRYMTIVQGLVSIFFPWPTGTSYKIVKSNISSNSYVTTRFIQNKSFLCKANRCSYHRIFENKKRKCPKVNLHLIWLVLLNTIPRICWWLQSIFFYVLFFYVLYRLFLCSYQRNLLISD